MTEETMNTEVTFKKARTGSYRQRIADHMIAHASSPMTEVLPGIKDILRKEGKDATNAAAANFYRWIVKEGYGPGVPEKLVRESKPKAPKVEADANEQLAA